MNIAAGSIRDPRWAFTAALLGSAVIHLMPLMVLLNADSMQQLYGIAVSDPATVLLLQHRGAVFGLMGGMLLIAVAKPVWRVPSLALVGASDLIFLLLALRASPLGPELTRVAAYDVLSLVLLAYAAWAIRPWRA